MASIAFHFDDEPTEGGHFRVAVPRFGSRCVCCGVEAAGRTLEYDPNTQAEIARRNVVAPKIPMPVCAACEGHALNAGGSGVWLGLTVLVLGFGLLGVLQALSLTTGLAVAGVALVLSARGIRPRQKLPGHAPIIRFEVHPGVTVLFTDNEALVTELLALNPGSKRH